MMAPTAAAISQWVSWIRTSHLGVDWPPLDGSRRRKATTAQIRSREPSTTSRADAAREGVELLEAKSWPWSTKTMIAPIAAIATSQPQRKAIARRRPDGMLSRTITVTTDVGLVKATASPSAATSATSVPTAPAQLARLARLSHPFQPEPLLVRL